MQAAGRSGSKRASESESLGSKGSKKQRLHAAGAAPNGMHQSRSILEQQQQWHEPKVQASTTATAAAAVQQFQAMDIDGADEQMQQQQDQAARERSHPVQEQVQRQQEQQPKAAFKQEQEPAVPKVGLGSKLVLSVKQTRSGLGQGRPGRSSNSAGDSKGDAVAAGTGPGAAAQDGDGPGAAKRGFGKHVKSSNQQQLQQQRDGTGKRQRLQESQPQQHQQEHVQGLSRKATAMLPQKDVKQKQQQQHRVDGSSRGAQVGASLAGSKQEQGSKVNQTLGEDQEGPVAAGTAPAATAAAGATGVVAKELPPAPEVSAASKDTAAAAAAAVAAASGTGLISAGGGGGGRGPLMLLGMPIMRLTSAAAALEEVNLDAPPSQVPMEEVAPNAEAVQKMLDAVMEDAKQLKKKADARMVKLNKQWDVFALCLYALSSVRFMEYMDYLTTMWDVLYKKNAVGNLRHPHTMAIYAQTAQMCQMAQQWVSNATGPDVAKQVLKMLLERLTTICSFRHLNTQQRALAEQIRRVKAAAEAAGANGGGAGAQQQQPQQQQQQLQIVRPAGRQQQQQQQQVSRGARAQATVLPAAAVTMAAGSSSSMKAAPAAAATPVGLKKGSPDHSMTSNQDTMTVVKLSTASPELGRAGSAPGASSASLDVRHAEQLLAQTLSNSLRVTEGIHQNVMRLQQFSESPEVMCNAAAKQAALAVGMLGIDAGMFSVELVARHTRAAVTEILKLLKDARKS